MAGLQRGNIQEPLAVPGTEESVFMRMIAAVDENWGIGKNGQLLVSIPNDMKFFRETTSGKVVVMGRKTLESFPGKKPLKNRVNIVLTRDESYSAEGAVIVHSIDELKKEIEKYDPDDVYCIGGSKVYAQLLGLADLIYITKIDHAYDADAYFPNLDESDEWKVFKTSEEQTFFDLTYHFVTYKRI